MLTLWIALASMPAEACSIAPPPEHVLDPESTDEVPPEQPVLGEVVVNRGQGPRRLGLGCTSVSSCDDLGFIDVALSADDDESPGAAIGFRVTGVDGELPDGLQIGTSFVELGGLSWHWIDGATDDQEAIDFVVRVVAVDEAGNQSEPLDIEVSDPGSGAGRCEHGNGLGAGLAVVVALAAARRRRRGARTG